MEPKTGTALLILAAFVLPGFVTLRIRERTHVITEEVSAFKLLLQSLYYASLVYGLASLAFVVVGITGRVGKSNLLDLSRGQESIGLLFGVAALVLFVLPCAVAEAGRRWQKSERRLTFLSWLKVDLGHAIDSGWNQAFRVADPSYVRVVLADGRVVGGRFSGESLVGYSEHAGDLYLAQRVALDADNWFAGDVAGSLGVWIARDQISSVEFYEVQKRQQSRDGSLGSGDADTT